MTKAEAKWKAFLELREHPIYGTGWRGLGRREVARCARFIKLNGSLSPNNWKAMVTRLFIDEEQSKSKRNAVFLLMALADVGVPKAPKVTKEQKVKYATVYQKGEGYEVLHRHGNITRAKQVAEMKSTEKRPCFVAEIDGLGKVVRIVKNGNGNGNGHPKTEPKAETPAPTPGNFDVAEEVAAKVLSKAEKDKVIGKIQPSTDESDLARLGRKIQALGARLIELDKLQQSGVQEVSSALAELASKFGAIRKSA